MTEPRTLAIVHDYAALHAAICARVAELGVTHETVDAVSGISSGYASKILAPSLMKSLGRSTLGPVLGTLGLALVVVEDLSALAQVVGRLQKRVRPVGKHPAKHGLTQKRKATAAERKLISDWMTKIGCKGAASRARKLPPWRRRQIARKAARKRWRKPKLVEITKERK